MPALENSGALQKKFAISQYPRSSGTTMPKRDDIMGYTIRTMRFRYTEWIKNDFTTRQPYNPKDVIAAELYDYELDSRETKNLVNDRSKKSIVQDLQKELHLFFEQQKKKVEVYNSYSDLSN